jgi:putative DNA methylase
MPFSTGAMYISCGDSSSTTLPSKSIDLVVTDPPFFDNVHYSELADFFYAWQQLVPRGFARATGTTRSNREVQDGNADLFAEKLRAVLAEMHRVMKENSLLVFSYHHSRKEGWVAIAQAVLGAGFIVVNSHPVKAVMSVAAPKTQAKEPIQIDILLVCRKRSGEIRPIPVSEARSSAANKIERLENAGLKLSANDRRVVLYGQLTTTLADEADAERIADLVNASSLDNRAVSRDDTRYPTGVAEPVPLFANSK